MTLFFSHVIAGSYYCMIASFTPEVGDFVLTVIVSAPLLRRVSKWGAGHDYYHYRCWRSCKGIYLYWFQVKERKISSKQADSPFLLP